jgi:hypothetical protein
MKLSEIKSLLNKVETVNFQLENGTFVPEHFHVTEIGVITKHFIDCGGTIRNEKVANFQLWDANDFEHKLKPGKLSKIIALSEKVLGMEDLEIEVEYQTETIGKYNLGFDGENFILNAKRTACLAKESCGTKQETEVKNACCSTESNCC